MLGKINLNNKRRKTMEELRQHDEESTEEINYNAPLEVTEIFRAQMLEEKKIERNLIEGHEEDHSEEVQIQMVPVLNEYGFKTAFGWEDIKSISEYPYPDNWTKFKGPKFNILIHNKPNEMIILGDYAQMYNKWATFRTKFPLFREYE
jgi:hypothetical protein